MFDLLTAYSHNPMIALYTLQAGTYVFAAMLSRAGGHSELASCYAASSLIHGLLAVVHLLHLG